MITVNVISSTSNLFNHTNNTHISLENPTSITPDGLTFSIWGPIYLFEFALVVYQSWTRTNFFNEDQRTWFALAFSLNALWLPVFAYEYWWVSLLIISGYLWALIKSYKEMDINYENDRSVKDKCCGYVGLSLNFAWVTVATLLNLTIVFRNSRIVFTESDGVITGGNDDWACGCIVFAFSIALYIIGSTSDIPYGVATAWALFGIYRNHSGKQKNWAIICAVCIIVFTAFKMAVCLKKSCSKKKKKNTNELTQELNA